MSTSEGFDGFLCLNLRPSSRGPKAARVYAETAKNKLQAGEASNQEIYVLRGGFSDFQQQFRVRDCVLLNTYVCVTYAYAKYQDDPELVEKFKKEVWQSNA